MAFRVGPEGEAYMTEEQIMAMCTDPTIEPLSPPPFDGWAFTSYEKGLEFVNEYAKRAGYAVRIMRSTNKATTAPFLPRRYDLACDRGGLTSSRASGLRRSNTKRTGCMWKANISSLKRRNNYWQFTMHSAVHNHAPVEAATDNAIHRRRKIEDLRLIQSALDAGCTSGKEVVKLVRAANPASLLTTQDVYNDIRSLRRQEPGRQSRLQRLMERESCNTWGDGQQQSVSGPGTGVGTGVGAGTGTVTVTGTGPPQMPPTSLPTETFSVTEDMLRRLIREELNSFFQRQDIMLTRNPYYQPPQLASRSGLQPGSQQDPQAGLQSGLPSGLPSVAQPSPQPVLSGGPQSGPQGGPQPGSQSVMQAAPQAIPRLTPQSIRQMAAQPVPPPPPPPGLQPPQQSSLQFTPETSAELQEAGLEDPIELDSSDSEMPDGQLEE